MGGGECGVRGNQPPLQHQVRFTYYLYFATFFFYSFVLSTARVPCPIIPPSPYSSSLQELNPAFYGLQTQQTVRTAGLLSAPPTQAGQPENIAQLEQLLRDIYCGNAVSAEFAYVEVSSGHIIFCIPCT